MELKEFVAETLTQILGGISDAQQTEGGAHVNAASGYVGTLGQVHHMPGQGAFTHVNFDVAVTAESTVGGRASIKVFGSGADGGGEHKSQTVSRVSFVVPCRLPDGDQSRDRTVRSEQDKIFARANTGRRGIV